MRLTKEEVDKLREKLTEVELAQDAVSTAAIEAARADVALTQAKGEALVAATDLATAEASLTTEEDAFLALVEGDFQAQPD